MTLVGGGRDFKFWLFALFSYFLPLFIILINQETCNFPSDISVIFQCMSIGDPVLSCLLFTNYLTGGAQTFECQYSHNISQVFIFITTGYVKGINSSLLIRKYNVQCLT